MSESDRTAQTRNHGGTSERRDRQGRNWAGEGISSVERRFRVERLAVERSDHGPFSHYIVPPTWVRGLRAADGVRERRTLAACQGGRETERSGGPRRVWSFAIPAP